MIYKKHTRNQKRMYRIHKMEEQIEKDKYIIGKQEQELERYKKMFEAKERFSKVMPEDMDFIILSKADYDRQQEDIELTAIELKIRIDKSIEYIKSLIENSKPDLYNDDLDDLHILLNILQGSDE